MSSAFPRLSPSGERMVSGEKIIIADGVAVGPGTSAQWAGENELYYVRQPDGAFMHWRVGPSGPLPVPGAGAFNAFSIGGPGRWAGYSAAANGVQFDNGTFLGGMSGPALSADPGVWAVLEHASGRIITHAGTPIGFADKDCRELRWADRALAWGRFEGGKWQIFGQRTPGSAVEHLNVEPEEFWPVPFEALGGLWVLTHSHTRLLLRPWGSKFGYVVDTGTTRFPDAKMTPNGFIRVVWDAGNNILGEAEVDPLSQRRDLSKLGNVEDVSGGEVDLWDYILPVEGAFPRDGSHEMHCIFDGRNFWTLPFGEAGHWVRMVVEDDQLIFREDHSKDGQSTGDYSFTSGLWLRRFMRPGEELLHSDNFLVRYAATGCGVVDVHAFPFKTALHRVWTEFDCGGDLGLQPVVAILYDPGGGHDSFELSYFAKGLGFFRWEEYNQLSGELQHSTEFNIFGGRAPAPTPGCWQPAHLLLRPTSAPSPMTLQELASIAIPPDIYLGALTRFIQEVLLPRDRAFNVPMEDSTVVESATLSRGAMMYFNPLYYKTVYGEIAKLGRAPNAAEWGSISVKGLDAAAEVYRREQVGGGNGGGEEPGGSVGVLAGPLRTEAGGGFVDDAGPVLPIFCHMGDAFSRWVRNPGEVESTLDDIARAGFHGIRFWSVLGGDSTFWNGRGVGPQETPDYWTQLQSFLLALHTRGLRCQLSQGDTRAVAIPDRDAFFRRLGGIVGQSAETVAVFEFGNESWQTGEGDPAEAARWSRVFTEASPQTRLVILSAPAEESKSAIDSWSRPPATLWNFHDYRGGRWWDKIRHTFSLTYEARPALRVGWSGEPPGYGDLVSAIENRDELDGDWAKAYAAMTLMARRGFVFFSGPGVKTGAGQRLQDMPGFWDVASVRDLLPTDIMRYSRLFHGGETFSRDRIFAASGDVRADHAYYDGDGRFVCLIYGPGSLDVQQTRAADIFRDVRFGTKARLVVGKAR